MSPYHASPNVNFSVNFYLSTALNFYITTIYLSVKQEGFTFAYKTTSFPLKPLTVCTFVV